MPDHCHKPNIKPAKLDNKTRQAVNKQLGKLVYNTYFEFIPTDQIWSILDNFGLKLLDVDGSEYNAILCGSSATLSINTNYDNSYLYLSWYKMPSGRFEVTSYLS